jgi:hypothetical protein
MSETKTPIINPNNTLMEIVKCRSSPSNPLFEVAARTRMLHPKPKPLRIPVNTTWLEVNQHSPIDTKYEAANEIHETLEEFYARTAAQTSSARHVYVGLLEIEVLVGQMHRSQHQESKNASPPSYSEAMRSPAQPDILPVPARTFSGILRHGDEVQYGLRKPVLKRNLPMESVSELEEGSVMPRTFSSSLRRSGDRLDTDAPGRHSGYTYTTDVICAKLHRKETAAGATPANNNQTGAEVVEPVSADVETHIKPHSHNRWREVLSTLCSMLSS